MTQDWLSKESIDKCEKYRNIFIKVKIATLISENYFKCYAHSILQSSQMTPHYTKLDPQNCTKRNKDGNIS